MYEGQHEKRMKWKTNELGLSLAIRRFMGAEPFFDCAFETKGVQDLLIFISSSRARAPCKLWPTRTRVLGAVSVSGLARLLQDRAIKSQHQDARMAGDGNGDAPNDRLDYLW